MPLRKRMANGSMNVPIRLFAIRLFAPPRSHHTPRKALLRIPLRNRMPRLLDALHGFTGCGVVCRFHHSLFACRGQRQPANGECCWCSARRTANKRTANWRTLAVRLANRRIANLSTFAKIQHLGLTLSPRRPEMSVYACPVKHYFVPFLHFINATKAPVELIFFGGIMLPTSMVFFIGGLLCVSLLDRKK